MVVRASAKKNYSRRTSGFLPCVPWLVGHAEMGTKCKRALVHLLQSLWLAAHTSRRGRCLYRSKYFRRWRRLNADLPTSLHTGQPPKRAGTFGKIGVASAETARGMIPARAANTWLVRLPLKR